MSANHSRLSPRQKMINLMYIVFLAMVALNVSSDVLSGFKHVEDALDASNAGAQSRNQKLYEEFDRAHQQNPEKVARWYDAAKQVRVNSAALSLFIDSLKQEIVIEADGKNGDPDNIRNRENLEAVNQVMLSARYNRAAQLRQQLEAYRNHLVSVLSEPDGRVVSQYLSTQDPEGSLMTWETAMFENIPVAAAVTILAKIQGDVNNAEGHAIESLMQSVDRGDVRVNQMSAFVIPTSRNVMRGSVFEAQIVMAAVDTTQRPEIYVNGRRISPNGEYNFRVGSPGEYQFSGYIQMPNAAGEIIRREFTQKYNVIAPPSGATVAADLMNVLYAGFDNPISVSASGIPSNKISVSMEGGTLTSKGDGHYIARPAQVGKDVTFSITGVVNGKTQPMGHVTFKVRKLPDPTPFMVVGDDHFRGGRLAKASILGAKSVGAAIDDGLLNIPFRVLSFKTVFFDRMGNAVPKPSAGPNLTEDQRNSIRELRTGNRFYISEVHAIGPDGIERTLTAVMEVIVK